MTTHFKRDLALLCPTCAGGQFLFETEESELIECIGCNRRLRRDELVQENMESIHEGLRDLAREAVRESASELRNSLRKAFQNSKHIRFK